MENKTYIPNVAEIENNKFYETFGNGTRLELLNSSFDIGKLIFRFQKFDVNSKKEIARLVAYLDIDKALCLANDILSGRLVKLAQNGQKEGLRKVYAQPGGSVKDGKIIYREISVSIGNKFIVSGLECAGKKTSTGGFVADVTNTTIPKVNINVGMDAQTLKSLAIMIQNEYQAYRTAQFVLLNSNKAPQYAYQQNVSEDVPFPEA